VKVERLRELVELNRFITSTLEFDELLERVVEKTAAFTAADACLLLLPDRDGVARVAACRGLDPERARRFATPFDERISTALMRLLGFREEDVFLGVPVIDHGSLRGLLAVYRRGPLEPDEEETYLVTALADQAAIALEHAARYRELSEEKERHLRLLQAIQSNTSTYLAYLDPELRFLEANAGFCQALGLACDELLGRRWDEVDGAPAILPMLEGVVAAAIAGAGRPHEQGSIDVLAAVRRAGMPAAAEPAAYWNVSARAVSDAAGRVQGVVVSGADVTEEVRARREVERANRRKDEFLAMLGHELRNPVAAIAGAAEVMRLADPGAPVEPEIRDVVYRQVLHMARLLDDLLDVSRITRGTIELKKAPLDLRDVVTMALQSARQLVRARDQELAVVLPDTAVWFHGDGDRLVQALSNLLSNAARYTPPGGRIEVALEPRAVAVGVRVRDTGEGISPQDLPFLFEPFLQSKRGLDRPGGGLGLGLTLVKQLIELHGGRVDVRSEGPGRGSEFTLWLPRAECAPEVRPGEAVRAPAPARRRVLIVEDNADFAASLAALLASEGHAVEIAADGTQALEVVARTRPQVVLLDIGLPEMDGFELARRIREGQGRHPLLVAISGYGREDDRLRAREAGIDHYLVKPFGHDRLRALLAAC
jgi:PAS domain S-box-containing protein